MVVQRLDRLESNGCVEGEGRGWAEEVRSVERLCLEIGLGT